MIKKARKKNIWLYSADRMLAVALWTVVEVYPVLIRAVRRVHITCTHSQHDVSSVEHVVFDKNAVIGGHSQGCDYTFSVGHSVVRKRIKMVENVMVAGKSFFFFSSRRRHTRFDCDWSSDVCSSD